MQFGRILDCIAGDFIEDMTRVRRMADTDYQHRQALRPS
jgi:hypothetical protein